MANLTGEYDVAVEATVAAVNRILAAIHENEDTRFPVSPHSFRMFVDDTARGESDPVPADERTGVQGIAEVQLAAPTISLPQGGLVVGDRIALARSAPSGGPWGFQGASDVSIGGGRSAARIGPLRGPWGFPEPSDISIRVGVRAWMQGSPQPPVPEFVHGDVIVNADIVRTTIGPPVVLARRLPGLLGPGLGEIFGGTFVGLDRDTMGVTFVPDPGTTVPDDQRSRIQRIIRNVLRSDFERVTFQVSVPEDVRAWDYRLDPQHASVMMMMLLAPRSLSSGAVSSIAGGLVPPGADFAIGIGRDYLKRPPSGTDEGGPLSPAKLFAGLPGSYSFSRGYGSVSAKVYPNWGGATVDLESGRILATIPGSGSVRYFGGLSGYTTDDFTFTVRLAFTLQAAGTSLKIVPLGDPDLELSGLFAFEGWIEDQAEAKIREERDKALVNAQAQIGQLQIASRLEEVLAGLSPSPPGVSLTGVQIRPEGVVVGGRMALAPSKPVVVRQVQRLGNIDALDSWIPGGTIDRFVWYADQPVVQGFRIMAAGGPGQHVEEHRFVREEGGGGPLPPVEAFQLRCLEVHGRRLTSSGAMGLISGHTCGFYVPVFPWPGVSWPVKDARAMPVVSLQGVRPDGGEGPVGHFNPWASGLAPANGGTSLVVHFADEGGQDIETLAKALSGARKAAVAAVVLLPSGGMGREPREIPETGAGFVVGEDPDGHWAESLGVSKTPATVVLDPRGRVAFKEEGRLSASKLAKVLGEHAGDGARLTWQPLRLGVVAGDKVPNFPFRLGRGAEMSMRRLRGRRVALSFWASWCEESLEQLRELARAYEASEGQGPIVLAVGDGEPADRAWEVAKAEGLPFPVIPDPDRTISSRFAVGVWPSTVWIGPDLRVESVTLGLTALTEGAEDRHKGAMQAY